jgi:hypothetical protein
MGSERGPTLSTGYNRIEITDGVTTKDEDKANAAFIVRACNSHEELLEACRMRPAASARWFML